MTREIQPRMRRPGESDASWKHHVEAFRRQLARKPGMHWRVLAWGPNGERYDMRDQGCFDELAVDHWIHLEQMDKRHWYLGIYGTRAEEHQFGIYISASGPVKLVHYELGDLDKLVKRPR